MSKVLFWRGGAVVEGVHATLKEASRLGCLSRPCVNLMENNPTYRYGTFDIRGQEWKHLPLAEFPKAFRLALLIMDVR